jgi:hypothetical protein
MHATVIMIEPGHWLMPGFSRVTIDLPHSVSTEIAGPGMRLSLLGLGEKGIEGERIEIEGRIVFPKKPYELTELAMFMAREAGVNEGSVWDVAFPSFPGPIKSLRGRPHGF